MSVSDYVSAIEKYRYMVEQDKLKRFYMLQSELLDSSVNSVPLSHILPMYYNTDSYEIDYDYYLKQFGVLGRTQTLLSLYGCNILDVQRDYGLKCSGILLDTTKTKKEMIRLSLVGFVESLGFLIYQDVYLILLKFNYGCIF